MFNFVIVRFGMLIKNVLAELHSQKSHINNMIARSKHCEISSKLGSNLGLYISCPILNAPSTEQESVYSVIKKCIHY